MTFRAEIQFAKGGPKGMTRNQILKAAGKCIQCRAGLLEHERTRCDECKAKNKRHAQTKKVLQRYAKRAREKYWRDPEGNRKKMRDKRMTKKLAAECRSCRRDALPDSDWCRTHRHQHRASSRRSMQKLRAGRAAIDTTKSNPQGAT